MVEENTFYEKFNTKVKPEKTENILPRLIMGGDAFFGFDNRPEMSVDEILSLMKHAYTRGVRAFEFSFQGEVMESVSVMKSLFPDVTFFANVSWRCGVNLNETDIIDLKARALNTVRKYLTPEEEEQLKLLPKEVKEPWFGINPSAKPFSESEIQRINLDLVRFWSRLGIVRQYAGYCLIGSDFGDWLATFGRTDLLEKMCCEISANGMFPIAITHWPSLILPRISKLPFVGYCCMLNSHSYLLSYSEISKYTALINKPIYGFRLLRGNNQNPQSIRSAINEALSIPGLYGAIIGLKSREEIDITVPIVLDELSAFIKG